jgi:phosphate transport system substrate-binding protein
MLRRACSSLAIALLLSAGLCKADADVLKVGGTGSAQTILQRLSSAYAARHPTDSVEFIAGVGTTGGITAVSEDVLQLSVSGRALKPAERMLGLESAPLLDTPFVFLSSHPEPQMLTSSNVVGIFDGTLVKWPDGREIKPVLRPKRNSATPFLIANFDGMQPAMDKLRRRPDVPVASTDQDNIEAAQKIANSFTGATLLQFVTEQPRLKLITLDGVAPSLEAMESGRYRLKWRLYVVVSAKPSAATQRFVAFLHSAEAEAIIRASGAAKVAGKAAAAR